MEQQTADNTVQTKSDLSSYLENINSQYIPKEKKKFTALIEIPQNIKYNINDIYKTKTKFGVN
jgi:hypothetical protein